MKAPPFNWEARVEVFNGWVRNTISVFVTAPTEASAIAKAEESADIFYDDFTVLGIRRIRL